MTTPTTPPADSRALFPEERRAELRERYQAHDAEPCCVCGAPMNIVALGGGRVVFACQMGEGESVLSYHDHYQTSRREYPSTWFGDSDVRDALAALETAEAEAARLRAALEQIQMGAGSNAGLCMDCDSLYGVATRALNGGTP